MVLALFSVSLNASVITEFDSSQNCDEYAGRAAALEIVAYGPMTWEEYQDTYNDYLWLCENFGDSLLDPVLL